MNSLIQKTSQHKTQPVAHIVSQKKNAEPSPMFADQRPEALQMRKLKGILQNQPISTFQKMAQQGLSRQNIVGPESTTQKQASDPGLGYGLQGAPIQLQSIGNT